MTGINRPRGQATCKSDARPTWLRELGPRFQIGRNWSGSLSSRSSATRFSGHHSMTLRRFVAAVPVSDASKLSVAVNPASSTGRRTEPLRSRPPSAFSRPPKVAAVTQTEANPKPCFPTSVGSMVQPRAVRVTERSCFRENSAPLVCADRDLVRPNTACATPHPAWSVFNADVHTEAQ